MCIAPYEHSLVSKGGRAMSLTTTYTSPSLRLTVDGPLIISHHLSAIVLADIQKYTVVEKSIVAAHECLCVLRILGGTALGKVPEDAKAEIAESVKLFDAKTVGTALVLDGTGVNATIMRTYLTGLNLTSKRKSPMKVFDSLDEACSWLAELPKQPAAVKASLRQVSGFVKGYVKAA